MNLTAGYNADIARVYGVNEALLLDTIVFWTRHSRRKDGYCWFTAEEFEVKTAIKPSAMKRAIDKLTAAGIIEVKNTYIIGTQIKCRHFKMIQTPKSEVSKVEQSDYAETVQSGTTEMAQSVNSSKQNSDRTHIAKAIGETPEKYGREDINDMFDYWESTVGYAITSRRQPNRNACKNLLAKYKTSGVKQLIDATAVAQADKYAPRISDFATMQSRLNDLLAWGRKKGQNNAAARF